MYKIKLIFGILNDILIYSYYSSILFFFFLMEDIEFILAIGIHVEFTIYNDDTSCLQNIKIHL